MPLEERAPCPCVVDVFELHRLCIELCTSCGISFSLILESHLHRICIELYKNPMQMRCKCDANAMLPLMGKEVQLHRICIVMKNKYDAKAMQITIQMRCKYECKCDVNAMQMRCKCDANATQMRCKCDAIMKEKNSTIASNLHRNERKNTVQIRCKLQCKSDANMVAYERQIRCKYDANTMQIRCKYDANTMLLSFEKVVQLHRICIVMRKNSVQNRCKLQCKYDAKKEKKSDK